MNYVEVLSDPSHRVFLYRRSKPTYVAHDDDECKMRNDDPPQAYMHNKPKGNHIGVSTTFKKSETKLFFFFLQSKSLKAMNLFNFIPFV